MLTLYRRHRKGRPQRGKGRKYRRCHCPIWTDGLLRGVEVRQSMQTTVWEKAQEDLLDLERPPDDQRDPEPVTIESAGTEFLADARARRLKEPTLYKYRLLLRQLEEYSRQQGLRFIHEFDLPQIRRFRASWRDGDIAALKKLERLRPFFRFAQESGWIAENPARKLANPIVSQSPTLPYDQEQMIRILAACEQYKDNYGRTRQPNAHRLRTFVLILRYSGLRLQDAVTLAEDRLSQNKLFLYTAKSGVPVYCPLPDFVVEALRSCPRTNPHYFFWSGESKPKSAVGDWQRALKKLFELAGVAHRHAHRFRDTFAVELLLAGVPMERVSILLGHRSVKVTEKHYAPWVRARQEQLEQDVKRPWSEDPIALAATKGTPEVHGRKEAVN